MKKIFKLALIIVVVGVTALAARYGYLFNNGLTGFRYNGVPKEAQIKVACIGDSITYGYGLTNWQKHNYPEVLNERLGEDYHVANFGVSESCVSMEGNLPYINTEEYEDSLDYEADVLIFMLGTNDSRIENWTQKDSFQEDYRKLIDTYLQGEKQPKIYLATCGKAYYMEEEQEFAAYGIRPELVQEVNEFIRELAKERGYEIIEIEELTEAHPEWFQKDGIHPDIEGNEKMAEFVAETIR